MATILTKKKDTSGAPSAGDLTNSSGGAELAVNTADKRLYTKDSGGNVVEVGTNPSTINIDAGSIDGTPIGANSASTGSFTTLNTSGAVVFNDAGADVDFRVESDTDANALFVEGSSGNVGIGTGSPGGIGSGYRALSISGSTGGGVLFQDDGTSMGAIYADNTATLLSASGARPMLFYTNSAERMRLTSGGDLLVGKTARANNTAGIELLGVGASVHSYGGQVMLINRLINDGPIVGFAKDGTTVGTIGAYTGEVYIADTVAGLRMSGSGTENVVPCGAGGADRDNLVDLGAAAARFDDIYATNATIQTSDRNEKQDIEELTEAETRVAVAAKNLMKKYRWKSAVAEKGDDARIHFGIIAQDLKAAFEAEGLDAGRYAMFIHSAWWETQTEVPAVEAKEAVYETQTDEEGNETQVLVSEAVEAKDAYTRTDTYETEAEAPEGAVRKERMGIRYNELLAFIIAAL